MSSARFLCPWDFSRQEYWSGLPLPSSGIFSTQGLNRVSRLGRRILFCWATREAHKLPVLSYKKEWSNTICSIEMHLEIMILSEVNQRERDKYHMLSLICAIQFLRWCKWTYLWNRNRLTDIKNKLTGIEVETWVGGGGSKSEAWDGHPHTALYTAMYR